jgi:hypothetical protein
MKDDIENWVMDVLSKPNQAFGNLPPCPYAKKAWIENKVTVKLFESFEYIDQHLSELKEVQIYCFETINKDNLSNIAKEYNKKYPNLLFLEEHPELIEEIGGFTVNQGKWAMLIIQNRIELEKTREKLKQTSYYENWSQELKQRILLR